MPEGAADASNDEGHAPRADGIPPGLLLHLGVGGLLGTVGGYGVGTAIPSVFIDAVHAGFHAGWLGGLMTFVALTRGRAAREGRSRGERVAVGALLLGGIGFILGFYGPMVLDPGANQGPLLGILYTGPAGVLVGAAGGWLWHRVATKHSTWATSSVYPVSPLASDGLEGEQPGDP